MNNKNKESAERAVPASRKFNTRKYFFNAILTLTSTQISKLMLVIQTNLQSYAIYDLFGEICNTHKWINWQIEQSLQNQTISSVCFLWTQRVISDSGTETNRVTEPNSCERHVEH